MFKSIGDGYQPLAEWISAWLKGDVNLRLPIFFERGCSYSEVPVNRTVANDLYRELILKGQWDILNCYADFLVNEKELCRGVVRTLMGKSLTILGYRRQTYDPSLDWGMFTERNWNKNVFGEHVYMFEHSKSANFVNENAKTNAKARALYFKGKLAKKDKKKEKILLKSATLGYIPAFSELAFTYEGMGDTSECIKWHEEGAKYGLQESCTYLASLNAGTEKEYEYLKLCYQNYGTYPSNLLRLASVIERDLYGVKSSYTESRTEKETILFDSLARVILEWSELDSDKTEEVNEARLKLARLILEKKIDVDGVLAVVLVEIAKLHKVAVDGDLQKLVEKYCLEEVQRIRDRLNGKMKESLSTFSREKNARVERDRIIRAPIIEAERREREEKERKERERKERELQEFIIEAKKDGDRFREEKRLSWARPVDLGTVAEYTKLKGETEVKHQKAVELYQEALDSNGEEDTINALKIAGEAGHPRAVIELSKYYHGYDEATAEYWLEKCAKQGNLNRAINSKWKWTISCVVRYVNSKDDDIKNKALEALAKLNVKTLNAEEEKGLKSLANSGNLNAIKVYCKFVKNKNESEWLDYVYLGANAGDDECVNSIIDFCGGIANACEGRYVALLKNDKVKNNNRVQYEWYKAYSDEVLAKKFGVNVDKKKAFEILKLLSSKKLDSDLKKTVRLELARCYEFGVGTEIQIYFASTHYRGYDDKKADILLKQFEEKQEKEIRERKALKLMGKYPCAQLSNLQKTHPFWANNIIAKYKTTAPEKLEANLKARDEYLRFGFTFTELYESDGTFKEYQARGAYLRKKAEMEAERNRLERERQEKIKRENEERTKQERLERERKEREMLTAIRTDSTTTETNLTAKTVSTATNNKANENTALSKVRTKYCYKSDGLYTDHLEYFFRMCQDKSTLGEFYRIHTDKEAVGRLLGVLPECILDKYEFAEKISQKVEKLVGCFPSVDVRNIVTGHEYHKYLERDFAGLPVYGGAINVEVSFLQDIRYSSAIALPKSGDLFYEEYQKFNNHEISKWVDFNEYSRESGLQRELYDMTQSEVSSGKTAARKITRAIAKEMLKFYKVIDLTYIGTTKGLKKYGRYVPLIPTKVNVTFNFWGND